MFDRPQRNSESRERQNLGQPSLSRRRRSRENIENRERGTTSERSQSEILQDFARSIGEVLSDITALEVNTMVVDRITGDKFIPWQTYMSIYAIEAADLLRRDIPEQTRSSYLSLRKKLQIEYALLVTDPTSSLYDPQLADIAIDSTQTIPLPNPKPTEQNSAASLEERKKLRLLLANNRFLRALRKAGELKACLDNQKRCAERLKMNNPDRDVREIHQKLNTDIIYAQTIVQLDGDIINRYAKEILEHPQRELIMNIHRESVMSGEKQWRGLFQFFLDLVQQALTKNEGGLFDFFRR